jgi:hypothetical protein
MSFSTTLHTALSSAIAMLTGVDAPAESSARASERRPIDSHRASAPQAELGSHVLSVQARRSSCTTC